MLISMTGYGEASGELDGVSYAIEIKAVNHRYLKTIIKLPETDAFLEDDIEKLLRKSLSRGTINCVLRLKGISANSLFEIDEVALRSVVQKLNKIGSALGDGGTTDIAGLLALPGIVQPAVPDEEQSAKVRKLVLELTQQAVEKLKQMREAEGKYLEADLLGHCEAMAEQLEWIRMKRRWLGRWRFWPIGRMSPRRSPGWTRICSNSGTSARPRGRPDAGSTF